MQGKAGRPKKPNRKINTGFRLDPDVRTWLDGEAKRQKQTVSSFINSHFRKQMDKGTDSKLDQILEILKDAKSAGKL
ncbi:hypothetical protein D3C87_124860 [compost metagenome]